MPAPLTINVLDDDPGHRRQRVAALRRQGVKARGLALAGTTEAGLATEATTGPQVLLIALSANLQAGLRLAQSQRQLHPSTGLLLVVAEGRLADRALAYPCGADLCLSQPLAPGELAAAVMALARRLPPGPGTPTGEPTGQTAPSTGAPRRLPGARRCRYVSRRAV